MQPLLRTPLLTVLLCASLLGTVNAWAVLGGPITATTSTTTPLAVQLRSSRAASPTPYTVQSTVLDTGTTVQEYATPAGVVFAVAWQGPVLPRLDTLLGSYFAAFTAEADTTRNQRSVGTPLNIENTKLVMRSSGRMGHFSGHAYAPSLVPGGVAISDVLP